MSNTDRINKNIQDRLNTYDYVISEKDFYPPEDKRLYRSGIEDIPDGDNFFEYCNWFFYVYENDIFDT